MGEVEEASFVQQSAEAFTYRDAFRFANEQEVLLQYLRCGLRVDVVSLSSGDSAEEKTKHQVLEEVSIPLRRLERGMPVHQLARRAINRVASREVQMAEMVCLIRREVGK